MQFKLQKIIRWTVFLLVGLPAFSFGQNALTLEEAMEIALKNSPDIISAELNMTISEENLNARNAAMKSHFSFQVMPLYYSQRRAFNDLVAQWNTNKSFSSAGEFVISQPIVLTDGNISLRNRLEYSDINSEYTDFRNQGYNNDLYLVLTQPLFTYNKLKMDLKRLRLDLENATLSYAIQRMYLEMQVTQYFYEVYQKQMALNIAEDEYENQKTSLEIIRSKVIAGLSPQEELYQAELNTETSRSNLQNSQVDLENTKDRFKQQIGIDLDLDFYVETDIQYTLVNVDLNKAIQHGLESRLELQQREISVKNSYNNLTESKAINAFKGDLSLSVGLFGENAELTNVYEHPVRSPNVAVSFNIPIWDWGERRSRIKVAEASIKLQELAFENQKTNIELAIRQSYRRLQNLALQIEIAEQSLKNAELTYEINLERYKNGDLTSMDLGLFQNQLSERKMNLSNSLISYKLELLNMKIQSLWDFPNDASFVPLNLQRNLIK